MDLSGSSLTILTEGGGQRGLGHITRCLAHAETWQAAGAQVYWRLDGDEQCRNLILEGLPDCGDHIVGGPWQSEADPLGELPADAVLVDSYGLTPLAAQSLSQRAEQVIFVDDTQALAYPPGVVLHPAPDPAPRQRDEARWLTGPIWQALRRPFREVPEPDPARAEIRCVLVLMGGTDAAGWGPSVADQVTRLLPGAAVQLVGPHDPGDGARWRSLGPLGADDLAETMKAADLAISAAGQTLFELAALGVPTVMLGVADNQKPGLESWPARTGFRNAGMVESGDFEARLSRSIAALALPGIRTEVSRRAWTQVDGLGAIRLTHALGRGE